MLLFCIFTLTPLPLVLEVRGSVPTRGEEKFWCPKLLSLVSLNKCAVINWMSPVQEKPSPVQVKEPYGNLDMVTCRLSSCNPEEYTLLIMPLRVSEAVIDR